MATIGTHAINHSLYSKPNFHPQRDFTPVGLVAESPNALVINPKVQANSIQDLIALAKSKPGGLNYGSSGAGTTVHLSAELFSVMTARYRKRLVKLIMGDEATRVLHRTSIPVLIFRGIMSSDHPDRGKVVPPATARA